MEFKSQICTTKPQSEALLALGLKKETADCMYSVMTKSYNGRYILEEDKQYHLCLFHQEEVQSVGFEAYEHIPAWSLNRLREICPENIFTGVGNQWHRVMYNGILTYEEGDDSLISFREANIYDRCISCIEWLIKEGYFNKDYLEERKNDSSRTY